MVSTGRLMVLPGAGTDMIFPRKSIGRPAMIGASGRAISSSFAGADLAGKSGGADDLKVRRRRSAGGAGVRGRGFD